MKKLKILIFIILFLSLFYGIPIPVNSNNNKLSDPETKDWTFMVYLDADNNLERDGIGDINEMEMEGSDSNINVIVQIDRISGYDASNGDWTGAKRYNIIKDYDSNVITSPVVQDLGEVNMGSAITLQNFIQWSKSNYPAENYALILWDHGSGIMYGDDLGGVCWDDSNGSDYLTVLEISSVLSNPIYSVDLIGFDACLMGSVEVHYQLKDYVDVIIGSEEIGPAGGYPYDYILNFLRSAPLATPYQLGQQIVVFYYESYPSYSYITQAAIKSLTANFIRSLDNFINDLDDIAISQKNNVQMAREASQEFDVNSYIDLYDFANEIQKHCSGPVDSSAQNVMNYISNIVIEEMHSISRPDAHGLSIYFPNNYLGYSKIYELHAFTSDLGWDEFLLKYYTGQD